MFTEANRKQHCRSSELLRADVCMCKMQNSLELVVGENDGGGGGGGQSIL
jgi:hypothetical protein